jgi:hypothetical protein
MGATFARSPARDAGREVPIRCVDFECYACRLYVCILAGLPPAAARINTYID